jgi:uncharacterized protein (TIGR03066 family)
MPLFRCPSCANVLNIADPDVAGKAFRCSHCGTTFRIPGAPPPATAPAPTPATAPAPTPPHEVAALPPPPPPPVKKTEPPPQEAPAPPAAPPKPAKKKSATVPPKRSAKAKPASEKPKPEPEPDIEEADNPWANLEESPAQSKSAAGSGVPEEFWGKLAAETPSPFDPRRRKINPLLFLITVGFALLGGVLAAFIVVTGAFNKPPEPDVPRDLLVGRWENEQNPKNTVEFLKDGSVVLKDGAVEMKGTYTFLSEVNIEVNLKHMGQEISQKLRIKVTKDELVTTDTEKKEEQFKRIADSNP